MQRFYSNWIIKKLANLQLAIVLLLLIGIVVGIGTVIEQDQSLVFYQNNYPEINSNFFNWRLIMILNFDHIYTAYWFLGLLFLFSCSLLSCTLNVQLPTLERLKRWKFYINQQKTANITGILPLNQTNSLLYQLHTSKYNIFRQGKKSYAYSGLLGRFGPIVVHASIILLLIGSTLGAFGGYTAQEIVPRGEIFHVQNLIKIGTFSNVPQNISWRINDFWITYTKESKINQFYSDLSLLDNVGNELNRKTIFVNEPFFYNGLSLYQTDWDINGLKFKYDDGAFKQLPLKRISRGGNKIWFGSIVIRDANFKQQNLSLLINDLRGYIYIYDDAGKLIQEGLLGQLITLPNNNKILVSDFLTSTGLQIKVDPGIKIVYFAFFLLIFSTYASFISYSQIYSFETELNIKLGGTSNRAILFFQKEFNRILNRILA